jgi:hypothetical protein
MVEKLKIKKCIFKWFLTGLFSILKIEYFFQIFVKTKLLAIDCKCLETPKKPIITLIMYNRVVVWWPSDRPPHCICRENFGGRSTEDNNSLLKTRTVVMMIKKSEESKIGWHRSVTRGVVVRKKRRAGFHEKLQDENCSVRMWKQDSCVAIIRRRSSEPCLRCRLAVRPQIRVGSGKWRHDVGEYFLSRIEEITMPNCRRRRHGVLSNSQECSRPAAYSQLECLSTVIREAHGNRRITDLGRKTSTIDREIPVFCHRPRGQKIARTTGPPLTRSWIPNCRPLAAFLSRAFRVQSARFWVHSDGADVWNIQTLPVVSCVPVSRPLLNNLRCSIIEKRIKWPT